jgi:hypothetical protein
MDVPFSDRLFTNLTRNSGLSFEVDRTEVLYVPSDNAIQELFDSEHGELVRYIFNYNFTATRGPDNIKTVLRAIVLNHVQADTNIGGGHPTALATYCHPASSFKFFSKTEEMIEGRLIDIVDGIEVEEIIGKKHYIGGLLMTPVQVSLIQEAMRTGNIQQVLLPTEEIKTELEGLAITIGTDYKIVKDLQQKRNPRAGWAREIETLEDRYNDLRSYITYVIAVKDVQDTRVNLDETIQYLRNVAGNIIKDMEKNKVCLNNQDWIDLEDIADIPFDQYIRLSNGACWAVENLIEYFKRENGFNKAPTPSYPTRTLFNRFAPEIDMEHLFEHPIAQAEDLREWYKQRCIRLRASSLIISDVTMQTLKNALERMVSRGPAFVEALSEYLSADMIEALHASQGSIEKTGRYAKKIKEIIDDKIKVEAVAGFLIYLDQISANERTALEQFEVQIVSMVRSCAEGGACVWYTADIFRNLYNSIAEIKDIPKIFSGKAMFDHITPAIIELPPIPQRQPKPTRQPTRTRRGAAVEQASRPQPVPQVQISPERGYFIEAEVVFTSTYASLVINLPPAMQAQILNYARANQLGEMRVIMSNTLRLNTYPLPNQGEKRRTITIKLGSLEHVIRRPSDNPSIYFPIILPEQYTCRSNICKILVGEKTRN